jgi:hypothetical protein
VCRSALLLVGADSEYQAVMYVYYFVHLRGVPAEWAHWLTGDGDPLQSAARKAPDGLTTGDPVRVRLHPPHRVGGGFSIPFDWDAPGVFSGLNGDLSLQPLEPGTTQLSIRGSYAPDGAGHSSESHRLVEAHVKRALDSLAAPAI